MIKTNTLEQRQLKRSKRLQKKLALGEFKENLHQIVAKFEIPAEVRESGSLDYLHAMTDQFIDHIDANGGMVSMTFGTIEDKFIQLDGCVAFPANKGEQFVIDILAEYINKSLEFTISEGKDNNYDPVWDLDDSFAPENWKTIFKK